MRQETITLYKFQELPTEAAKEAARDKGRQWMNQDPAWCDESRESIERFCSEFGAMLRDWSVGAYSPIDYSHNADNENFRGRKLREFNREAMPTGYCLDCALWQTFYDEFKRTGSAKKAFDAALWAGFKEWRDDLENQLSDEYIDDFLTANEYEFTETGTIH